MWNWLQSARNLIAESSLATIGITVSSETRKIRVRPWEEERNKEGVKTETLGGSGLVVYPGRSCCDAEISKHTNTVCNILQQR